MEAFCPEAHPAVVCGALSERQVANEIVQWFSGDKHFDGYASLDDFNYFYSCLSPSIDSDEEFIALVRSSWRLNDNVTVVDFDADGEVKNRGLRPPPPQYPSRHGRSHAPLAKQSHGDLINWSQEAGGLESSHNKAATTLRKTGYETRGGCADVLLSKNKYGKQRSALPADSPSSPDDGRSERTRRDDEIFGVGQRINSNRMGEHARITPT